jgi:hypothetical protein
MVDPERRAPESDWDQIRPARPERSLDALEQRIAALEQRVPKEEPWWRNPKTVTVIASLLAAFVPITTAVDGYFKSKSDLELATQQQRHAMRMDYMKTALDPEAPEMQRQSRLRLLIAILDSDDPVRTWAQSELNVVNGNVEELKTTLKNTQNELAQAQAEELKAKQDLSALESKVQQNQAQSMAAPQAEQHALQTELQKAKQKLQSATERKDHLSSRAADTSVKLTGQSKSALLRLED